MNSELGANFTDLYFSLKGFALENTFPLHSNIKLVFHSLAQQIYPDVSIMSRLFPYKIGTGWDLETSIYLLRVFMTSQKDFSQQYILMTFIAVMISLIR